jgi:hypothetical protein
MSRRNPGHENRLQIVAWHFSVEKNFSTLNVQEDCLGGLDFSEVYWKARNFISHDLPAARFEIVCLQVWK